MENMTFSYSRNTRKKIDLFGTTYATWGTFTNGATDSGGDIDTGLGYVYSVFLQHKGGTAVATAPVVNETLPKSGGTVTIVTAAGADGFWLALGEA